MRKKKVYRMAEDQNACEANQAVEEAAKEEAVPETAETPEQAVASEDQWREALTLAVKQRDEYLQMAQRAQADFQNFKRRNERTRAEGYDDGVREALAALLPAIDNMDRALKAAEADPQSLIEGVRMTERQMLEAMAKLGLEEVPGAGEKFDPEIHDAVMRVHEGEPGTVLEVFEKGYRAKGRMIRYAKVKVAAE